MLREAPCTLKFLNEDGCRMRGFSKDDAVGVTGDSVQQSVARKTGQLSDLPDGRYLLRLHLDNAEVFAVTPKQRFRKLIGQLLSVTSQFSYPIRSLVQAEDSRLFLRAAKCSRKVSS